MVSNDVSLVCFLRSGNVFTVVHGVIVSLCVMIVVSLGCYSAA